MATVTIAFPGANFEGDSATARLYLAALGETEVKLVTPSCRVLTGADIALLILERAES
jgi:hypothetical protein